MHSRKSSQEMTFFRSMIFLTAVSGFRAMDDDLK